ncbi:MAG: hypothetical protein CL748_00370 [Chloroflexi bacterium]|nr:hypothetical protein [Chloroflexota bacterium]
MTKINYHSLIMENFSDNFSENVFPQNFSIGIYNENQNFFSSYSVEKNHLLENKFIDQNSVFRIASITKTFIATAIIQLRDLGRLTLDDPLLVHMPDFTVANSISGTLEKVTLKRMLTHYSGLTTEHKFTNWNTRKFITKNDLIENLSEIDIVAQQDSQWKYSNLAYCLLGILIEKITEIPLEKYIKDEILQPLGLNNTFFYPSLNDKKTLIPGNKFSYIKGKLINEEFIEMNSMIGAGGLFSSTNDLINWILFQLSSNNFPTGQILDPDSLFEMHMPIYISDSWKHAQGYAWRISKHNDNTLHMHGGGIFGYASNIVFSKQYNCGVVILSDLWPNNLPNDFSISLISSLIDKSKNKRIDNQDENNKKKLQRFTGTYFAEPGLYLDLEYKEGNYWLLSNNKYNNYKMHAPSILRFVENTKDTFIVSSGRAKGELFTISYDIDSTNFILGGFKYIKLKK